LLAGGQGTRGWRLEKPWVGKEVERAALACGGAVGVVTVFDHVAGVVLHNGEWSAQAWSAVDVPRTVCTAAAARMRSERGIGRTRSGGGSCL
jgi:hypothetical protein